MFNRGFRILYELCLSASLPNDEARARIPAFLVLPLLFGFSLPSNGQVLAGLSAGDSTLRELIGESLSQNPAIARDQEAVNASAARVIQASTLPDPMVSVDYETARRPLGRWGDGRKLEWMVSQPIPFPGKLGLAADIAATDVEIMAQPLERTRLSITAAVRRAYVALLFARENLAVLEEQKESWRQIEGVTRSQYSAGMGGQPDVLRAQAELTRLEQLQFEEEANSIAAVAELNRLRSHPAGSAITTRPGFPVPVRGQESIPDLEQALARAFEGSPEIAAAVLAVRRAKITVDLAKRNLLPDFVGTSRYMSESGMPSSWAVGAGVSVPLFAPRKQKQAIVESEARLRSEQAAESELRLRLRASTEARLARLTAAVKQAESYSEGTLVQDRLAVSSSLANYQTGKLPFVAILEANNALFSDRRAYVARLAEIATREAELLEFLPGGNSVEPMTSGSAGPFPAVVPSM